MKHYMNRWTFTLMMIAAAPLVAATAMAGGKTIGAPSGVHPSKVEPIAGSEVSRVILTERAIERIALETDTVREEMVAGTARTIVPYSSLIYDAHARTCVYTSDKPRTFVRKEVNVDFIEGDRVVLNSGPAVGTTVASVGVAELYGAESGVGH